MSTWKEVILKFAHELGYMDNILDEIYLHVSSEEAVYDSMYWINEYVKELWALMLSWAEDNEKWTEDIELLDDIFLALDYVYSDKGYSAYEEYSEYAHQLYDTIESRNLINMM